MNFLAANFFSASSAVALYAAYTYFYKDDAFVTLVADSIRSNFSSKTVESESLISETFRNDICEGFNVKIVHLEGNTFKISGLKEDVALSIQTVENQKTEIDILYMRELEVAKLKEDHIFESLRASNKNVVVTLQENVNIIKLQGQFTARSFAKDLIQSTVLKSRKEKCGLLASNFESITSSEITVFVTSVASPSKFWIHNLDCHPEVVDEIAESLKSCNFELHEPVLFDNLEVGDYVAAFSKDDGEWYRAQVVDKQNSNVALKYIDYGNGALVGITDIRCLSEDFLKHPAQAIECTLHGVKPKGWEYVVVEGRDPTQIDASEENSNLVTAPFFGETAEFANVTHREHWSANSIDVFEEISYTSDWVALTAFVKSYDEKKLSYSVELFDPQKNVKIADELVKMDFAVHTFGE